MSQEKQQPDPVKASFLEPAKQGRRRQKPGRVQTGQWEAHQSDQALDAWGVALRALRKQGHTFE